MRTKCLIAGVVVSCFLSACGTLPTIGQKDGAPSGKVDISSIPDAVPKVEPRSRYGNPESYEVFGETYELLDSSDNYHETGLASWYGTKFHGRRTSSGEPFDLYKMTAAHKTLPIPCYAKVTNLKNGKSVVVKINDRGPFHPDRIIDLSYVAAVKLGFADKGTAPVEVKVIQGSVLASEYSKVRQPGRHYLQVGAFRDANTAKALAKKIKIKTQLPVQLSVVENKETITRVRVGPLSATQKIPHAKAQLAAIDIRDPLVIVE